jgi:hypothetical protein
MKDGPSKEIKAATFSFFKGCHDLQYKSTKHNDAQLNSSEHKTASRNDTLFNATEHFDTQLIDSQRNCT